VLGRAHDHGLEPDARRQLVEDCLDALGDDQQIDIAVNPVLTT